MIFSSYSESEQKIYASKVNYPINLFFENFDEKLINILVEDTNRYFHLQQSQ